MTTVKMTRDFRDKAGFTRVWLMERPTDRPEGRVEFKLWHCYPSYNAGQDDQFVCYLRDCNDNLTKAEANKLYEDFKKRGFTAKVVRR